MATSPEYNFRCRPARDKPTLFCYASDRGSMLRMERRLSAIFAADMVGYSRLMEADEVGTLERQKTHRREFINPTFEKYHGRIVKEMGDGLLVEFPSVVDAVQCAVAIQRAMPEREADVPEDRRITYRVGINLGDIIVEGEDIHGDGVNVAARLEQLSEPGGICISGAAYDQLRSTVEVGYQSLGEVQVKNIERPIRAYRVLTETSLAGTVIEKRQGRKDPRHLYALGFALLLAIGVAGWWWSLQPDFKPADPDKFAFAIPDKPSIAVLPFDNLSGDPSSDFIGDSLTENIIAELSTVPEIIVIARNSVFTYKNRPVKVQQVAEELGVRYVLEGSVQPEGDRVRVVVQLVDALDGKHLWSERYDYQVDSVLDLQDDLTLKLREEMQVALTVGEQGRRWRADARDMLQTREDMQMMIEGRVAFQKWSREGNHDVERLWGELYKRYPDTVSGNLMMAYVHYQKAVLFLTPDPRDALKIAWKYANAGKQIDGHDQNPDFHLLLANLYLLERGHEDAIAHVRKALDIAPSSADPYSIGSSVMLFSGQLEECVRLAKKGMRLEPDYPLFVAANLSFALMRLGQLEEGRNVARQILSLKEPVEEKKWVLYRLAAFSVFEGDMNAAKSYIDQLLRLDPKYSISRLNAVFYQEIDRQFVEKFLDALRQAGLPESS